MNARGKCAVVIYLDTKDLISLLDGSDNHSADEFEARLRDGGHELVLSSCTIFELAAPLRHPLGKINVMKRLNRLERLPINFISDDVPRLELVEALHAFSEGREYKEVYPFVDRLDASSNTEELPFARQLLDLGLAESVFEIWCREPQLLDAYHPWAQPFNEVLNADRALSDLPNLDVQFANTIKKNLALDGLPAPSGGVTAFARWIRSAPSRCPSEQLRFETFNQLRTNVQHIPSPSTFADLVHLVSLPYVDLMTLDVTMASYVRQASRSLSVKYGERILRNVDAVIAALD